MYTFNHGQWKEGVRIRMYVKGESSTIEITTLKINIWLYIILNVFY